MLIKELNSIFFEADVVAHRKLKEI